ncbi:hypothetical protein OG758_01105 [Streptomyces sp. NBC_01474]|uniref:hypothetical protein n=1 Tax=unclassified Streptomyces TaxID=2593676 RepID=UPI002DDA20DF|nr:MULTISPECIES: hypothetical protein [unclassified Streptomyces]WSD92944.1 hypothetical protein OG758_01105 [Streptomyces sp. NBC_01474]
MPRMKERARTAVLQAAVTGGLIYPNRLYQGAERLLPGDATSITPVSSYLTERVSS